MVLAGVISVGFCYLLETGCAPCEGVRHLYPSVGMAPKGESIRLCWIVFCHPLHHFLHLFFVCAIEILGIDFYLFDAILVAFSNIWLLFLAHSVSKDDEILVVSKVLCTGNHIPIVVFKERILVEIILCTHIYEYGTFCQCLFFFVDIMMTCGGDTQRKYG